MATNLSNLNLGNLTGTEITRKESSAPTVLRKLTDQYEEHSKLVFIFDVSSSMDSRIAKSYTTQYDFSPAVMARVWNELNAAFANIGNGSVDQQDLDKAKVANQLDQLTGLPIFVGNDEQLQERIVQVNAMGAFSITIDSGKKYQAPPTRIGVVRRLAKSELEKRFAKFPKSKVAVVLFASGVKTLFNDGAAADLWPVLENRLQRVDEGIPDGTDILLGIHEGMAACSQNPSAVGVHHFIVVSDGQDYQCGNYIADWIPTMQQSGIVLDYIHIGDEKPNDGLKAACAALGGESVTVNSERDLETKFVEMAARLCLPAGK